MLGSTPSTPFVRPSVLSDAYRHREHSTYQDNAVDAREKEVGVQTVRRELVLLRHVEVFCRGGDRVDEPELRSLPFATFSIA